MTRADAIGIFARAHVATVNCGLRTGSQLYQRGRPEPPGSQRPSTCGSLRVKLSRSKFGSVQKKARVPVRLRGEDCHGAQPLWSWVHNHWSGKYARPCPKRGSRGQSRVRRRYQRQATGNARKRIKEPETDWCRAEDRVGSVFPHAGQDRIGHQVARVNGVILL